MASRLKTYSFGPFVSETVHKALKLRPHIRHATVYIVAESKAAAAALYNAMAVGIGQARPQDLRVGSGVDLEAILAAGFWQQPGGVFLTADEGGNDRLVLRATGHGQVKPAGYLHHEPGYGNHITLIGSTAEDGDTAPPVAVKAAIRAATSTAGKPIAQIKLTGVETELMTRLADGDTIIKEANGTFLIGRPKKGYNRARRPAVTRLIEHGFLDEHREPRPDHGQGDLITYLLNIDGKAWLAHADLRSKAPTTEAAT